jgi:hypothetical protein
MKGQPVQATIAEAIIKSPFFLVVLSQSFVNQEYPEAELKAALAFDGEYKKAIMPVFYKMSADECHHLTRTMYKRLSDSTGWVKRTESDQEFAESICQELKEIAKQESSCGKVKVWKPNGDDWKPRSKGGLEVLWQLTEDLKEAETEQFSQQSQIAAGYQFSVQAFLAQYGWQYDVFICHTGADKPFIEMLYAEMAKCNLKAFFDRESLMKGQPVQATIAEAIIKSPFFLVVLSQSFVNQEYPEAELKAALAFDGEYKKAIMPVFYKMSADECHHLTRTMYKRLSDSTGWVKRTESDQEFAESICQELKEIAKQESSCGKVKVWKPNGDDWKPRSKGGLEVLWQLTEDLKEAETEQFSQQSQIAAGYQFSVQAFLAQYGWHYDVFICHTGADKPFVQTLYGEMAKCGLKAFFDFLAQYGWQYDVFICHTGADKPFIEMLYAEMAKKGECTDSCVIQQELREK